MKFGIHSLLFSETFLERDLPLLDKAKAMGFDALEIIPFDPDNFPATKVKQRAKDMVSKFTPASACPRTPIRFLPTPRFAPTRSSIPSASLILARSAVPKATAESTTAVGAT